MDVDRAIKQLGRATIVHCLGNLVDEIIGMRVQNVTTHHLALVNIGQVSPIPPFRL